MKKLFLSALLIVCSIFTNPSIAKQKVEKVEVKCHVELYGGGEAIHFRKIKKSKLDKLEQRLVNKKIKVAKTKVKQKIYKVLECVTLDKEFSKPQSRSVDKKTAR
jgi:hypothetical protein